MSPRVLTAPRPYLLVLGAATCWGTLGTAYALILAGVAVSPITVVFLRAASAFALLLSFAIVVRRDLLWVRGRDLPALALFGLICVSVFYVALIYTFQLTGVAMGTVLLYLAPAFVTLASAICYDEAIGQRKAIALGLCLLGTIAIVQPWRDGVLQANAPGIALGLLSAITYGAYSLLGKPALRRYPPLTLLLYALGFGTLGLLPVQVIAGSPLPTGWTLIAIVATTGLLITLLPLILYTTALHDLPASSAAIAATFEPAVAIVLAAAVLHQFLTIAQLAGAIAIIAGVIVLASGERPQVADRAPVTEQGKQQAPATSPQKDWPPGR